MAMQMANPKAIKDSDQDDAECKKDCQISFLGHKHPLQNCWCLWFLRNEKNRVWSDNLRIVTKFDTVEDFWALYNHIQPASRLLSGSDYSVFKDGISPMWEDEKNRMGGRWLVMLSRQQRHLLLDTFWLETLLCLIGEAFEEGSGDICGSVLSVRSKGDRVALWTSDADRKHAVLTVGRIYKERLGLHPESVMAYQPHADTAAKSGDFSI
uniref:eukaryotic translation initiation factor 4E-1A-like isoform X2 n=1 Tax=Myxine glutinosa TaxID=7769 RepID=UPI00358E2029